MRKIILQLKFSSYDIFHRFYVQHCNYYCVRLKSSFTKLLLRWNDQTNQRYMPWRGEKIPYLIWLSEVILQQTRVEQGLPYFVKFKEAFPTIKDLADAKEDKVMKLWQGLGYYSRARNLHFTAKYVAYDLKGEFPSTFESLKKLKGVGDYTAAAIASFAFNEKQAVVDGNVIRVLARVFGIETPFDTTEGKKQFAQQANLLIDGKQPGVYNQAIMDFGSQVCVPQKPQCEQCQIQKICFAYEKGLVNELPVRAKKTEIKNRYFNYLLLCNGKEVLIQKRTGKDIWNGLYELPLLETDKPLKRNVEDKLTEFIGVKTVKVKSREDFAQLLSHRKIHFSFFETEAKNLTELNLRDAQKVKLKDLHLYAFPRSTHLYLEQKSLL